MAGFRRQEHIRRRADFQRVYQQGSRIHGRFFTLFLLKESSPAGGPSRLGVAATKKLGGAVERNRAKRLIREVFRRNKIAPGFDVVVVPKREILDTTPTSGELDAEYQQIVERSLNRHRRQGRPVADPSL